jgi:hypothetical protein
MGGEQNAAENHGGLGFWLMLSSVARVRVSRIDQGNKQTTCPLERSGLV